MANPTSAAELTRIQNQRLADGAACLEAALDYLSLGMSVLCLCPPDHAGVGLDGNYHKDCDCPGKRPVPNDGRWKEFQDRLPTVDEVQEWWRLFPTANVGCAMGPVSGLIRIDVEGSGEVLLQQKSRGDLPPTWEFFSGRKNGTGRGLLYRIPAGANLRTTVETHGKEKESELRFQTKGAQTVLPPSRHGDGNLYTWKKGFSPVDIEPAGAPAWLLKELDAGSDSARTNGHHRTSEEWTQILDGVPEGGRNSAMTALIGKLLAQTADVSNDNQADMVWQIVLLANNNNQPPLKKNELETIFRSIRKTEIEKRQQRDTDELNKFVARQIEEAQKTPPPVERSSIDAKPPKWHLIIVGRDPASFLLRSPFWSDSPLLEDGYLPLDENQIHDWGGAIYTSAIIKAHKVPPRKLTDWGTTDGHLARVLQFADHRNAAVESRRPLYILGWLYRYLREAVPASRNHDDNDNFVWSHYGDPVIGPEGATFFKFFHLEKEIKRSHEDFSRKEITAVLGKHAQAAYPDRTRWWKVSAVKIGEIGRLTEELGEDTA